MKSKFRLSTYRQISDQGLLTRQDVLPSDGKLPSGEQQQRWDVISEVEDPQKHISTASEALS